MRATDFEFRHRFWVLTAPYVVGFGLYRVDPMDAVQRVVLWVVPGVTGPTEKLLMRVGILAGAAAIVAAGLVRTWAAAYLRSAVVHDNRLHGERLVADGPFRHLRNPLYLGTFLMALGMSSLASLTGAVVMVGGTALVLMRLVGREEEELAATQGAAYEAYRARVPSFVPAVLPRLPASGARPQWGQAVVGELLVWSFAAGILALAVTLNSRPAMGVWGAGFVLHLLTRTRPRADERETSPETDA